MDQQILLQKIDYSVNFLFNINCTVFVYYKVILLKIYLYFLLCWVFVAALGCFLVVASGGYVLLQCEVFSLCGFSHCSGFSCCRVWTLGCIGSTVAAHRPQSTGSVVVAYRLSCSATCGIFPDQGSNLCPLHWQVDS